jgi:IMP dehydrogenase/GMP reductase
MGSSTSVVELQEQLLALEEELMRREEALAEREEKARISKKALVKVSIDLDAERVKAEATRKEYLDKMEAHTIHTKHSLNLDKMLGEQKVHLDERDWDLDLREAVMVEAQSQGLNPRDNHEELMEIIEL